MALTDKNHTPYALDCQHCRHKSFLTPNEYAKQLQDTTKDGFVCPRCNSEEVSFDESHYEKIMGVRRKG